MAQQAFPHNPKYMVSAYLQATAKPFKYLLFDASPNTEDLLRLRTDIMPYDKRCIVFLPKRTVY